MTFSGVDTDRLISDYRAFLEVTADEDRADPEFVVWLMRQPLGYLKSFGVWDVEDIRSAVATYAGRRLHMRWD